MITIQKEIKKFPIMMLGFICMILFTSIQSNAETTVLPADPSPCLSDVIFHNEDDGKNVYKTGDILTISLYVNDMAYNSETTLIDICEVNLYRHFYITYNMKDNTVTELNCSWASNCNVQFDEDSGKYTLEFTLKEDESNSESICIGIISVENGEKEAENRDFTRYSFVVNDNCAAGNHTIREDTSYTIDVHSTCVSKGSKSKHCIICCNIIEDTIEEIPLDYSNHSYFAD